MTKRICKNGNEYVKMVMTNPTGVIIGENSSAKKSDLFHRILCVSHSKKTFQKNRFKKTVFSNTNYATIIFRKENI